MDKLPISVIITTKNEERNIERCLNALTDFSEIIVVDSHSADNTVERARKHGAAVVLYRWDGKYPKKRQWCLDTLDFKQDWVFWVDADEVITPELVRELHRVFSKSPDAAGFFIKGRYVWEGTALRYGLQNNKIALFHRERMCFPVVDDLDIAGMGEIEGHYQPVLRDGFHELKLGHLKNALLHYAYDDQEHWLARHERYAQWESEMIKRDLYPKDPVAWRESVKNALRRHALRPYITFLYGFFMKFGVLDGKKGFNFAKSRMNYALMVQERLNK